jgi:hypothetical protein
VRGEAWLQHLDEGEMSEKKKKIKKCYFLKSLMFYGEKKTNSPFKNYLMKQQCEHIIHYFNGQVITRTVETLL